MQPRRQRNRYEAFAFYRDEDVPTLSGAVRPAHPPNEETQFERCPPHRHDLREYLDLFIEENWPEKVALDASADQPKAVILRDGRKRKSDRTEQFRLGHFEEAQVGAVTDNPGGIHVAPAGSLHHAEGGRGDGGAIDRIRSHSSLSSLLKQ